MINGQEGRYVQVNVQLKKLSPVAFSLMDRLNVVQSSFFKCTKYMDYTIINNYGILFKFTIEIVSIMGKIVVVFYAFSAYLHRVIHIVN